MPRPRRDRRPVAVAAPGHAGARRTDGRAARRASGRAPGPDGAPAAIALTPILSARYRARDLERIREAAPGARIVTLSVEGLVGRPGRRRRGAAARLAVGRRVRPAAGPRAAARLGPLGVGRRRAGADAGGPGARHRDHERPRRLLEADRRVRDDDDPVGQPEAARAARAPAGADVAAARGHRAARRDRRDRRARVDRAGGRRAGDGVRLPGRRDAAAARGGDRAARRRGAVVRRGDARPGRRPGDVAGAARGVRLRRAGGPAHARDREHDRRPTRSRR